MVLTIRHNNNVSPRLDNNCDDGSCNVLPYDGHYCDTVISENTGFISNISTKGTNLFLLSFRIGGTKYRIYARKTEIAYFCHKYYHYQNGLKMVSNTFLIINGDKGVTDLLRKSKYIVIVVESMYTFQNKPHSTRFVFYETKAIYT